MGFLHDLLLEHEKLILLKSLEDHYGNRTKTAKWLGISRRSLVGKIKRFKIQVPYVRQFDFSKSTSKRDRPIKDDSTSHATEPKSVPGEVS